MESTDAFATGRSNLRDTIKWLATTFAALAAVILAGTPFSGFGSLRFGSRLVVALAGLFGASVFLLLAWAKLIRLLRPDAVFASQLRERWQPMDSGSVDNAEIATLRMHLAEKRTDFLPKNIGTLDELDELVTKLWDEVTATGNNAKMEEWKAYNANLEMILNYAAFARLHQRVADAIPSLRNYGVLALLGMIAFAWASSPAKGPETDRLVVLQQPSPSVAAVPMPDVRTVHFDSNRTDIGPEQLKAITEIRDFLRSHPETAVLLMTHTDTVGGDRINDNLARRRGVSVREILVNQGGIPPTRIFITELPKTALPKVTGQQVAEADNRVVEFMIVQLPKPQ